MDFLAFISIPANHSISLFHSFSAYAMEDNNTNPITSSSAAEVYHKRHIHCQRWDFGDTPINLLQEYYKRDTSHRCGSFVHPLSFCTHSYHTLAPIKLFILLFRRRSALVSESDVVQLHLHLSCILLHLDSISIIWINPELFPAYLIISLAVTPHPPT